MLTKLTIQNFKRFENAEIELGQAVVFIGPNNSGKTTALQALALWEIGLRRWLEKHGSNSTSARRPGVTINRRDLIAIPVPAADLLWHNLRVRAGKTSEEGERGTNNVRLQINVEGFTHGEAWDCALEFDFANDESFYCRPVLAPDGQTRSVPEAAREYRMAYLPPMSGLTAREDKLESGGVNVRIGEGRTAEVLRNLCYTLATENPTAWEQLKTDIKNQFGVALDEPRFITERGEITLSYRENKIQLDIANSGRGLQQVLLLGAFIRTHPNTVLLLDEPDAHLEILRQGQIYDWLTQLTSEHNAQLIVASHSEIILNKAAEAHTVVAFVGTPHRMDARTLAQVKKSLTDIGYDQYYQAQQKGWVLYLEGSTDLAILSAFAKKLNHPATVSLTQPFVHYVANNRPGLARQHFFALREAKTDLVGLTIFDHLTVELTDANGLRERMWTRREIENYFCTPAILERWVTDFATKQVGPLFGAQWQEILREEAHKIEDAFRLLKKPAPDDPQCKVSDEFLKPLFENFFMRLNLPNILRKSGFHLLAQFIEPTEIDPEVIQMLDLIVQVAGEARPVG